MLSRASTTASSSSTPTKRGETLGPSLPPTLSPTVMQAKIVFIALDTDIESLQQTELSTIQKALLQILNLDPMHFKVEVEILAGSVILRVKITAINPDAVWDNNSTMDFHSELKSEQLVAYFDQPQVIRSVQAFPVTASWIGTHRTEAPVAPFDSCAGITCSGHGECQVTNGGARCVCMPGWFTAACSDMPLRLHIRRNVSECGTALVQALPGLQLFDCEGALNATGFTDVKLSILASPSADVACTVESTAPAEAKIVQPVGGFRQGDSIGTVTLHRIAGVADLTPGDDGRFSIRARCRSSDRWFEGAMAEALAFTTDVEFPRLLQMSPMITAFVGQQVTIRGQGLDGNYSTSVEIGGVSVSGPPIMRTVLFNETAGMLWDVTFVDEPAIDEWVASASA